MRSNCGWWLVAGGWWRHAALGAACAVNLGAQTTLAVPNRSNANVSLAASGQMVVAVWSATEGSATDIYTATSSDGGARFGPPVRVNSAAGEARVGGEQPPRVALVPGKTGAPQLVVVWTAKGDKGTRLLTSKSSDLGKTWSASTVVAGSDANGNRGWESVAVTGDGRVIALWLDHRNAASATPAPMHQHADMKTAPTPATKADPVEKAQLSQLYVGSADGAMAARAVATGVCYCCKTSIVASGPNVYATWRHVFPGNQRDIAFAASRDGGKTFGAPVRVSEDRWRFDGCPENGPAVAVDARGAVHEAWVTPLDGKEGAPLALFVASSEDGRSFSPRVRIPTDGAAGHVQLAAMGDASILLAWDEMTSAGRRIRLAKGTPQASGVVAYRAGRGVGDEEGVYPVVASAAGGPVVAWVSRTGSQSTIRVALVK